MADIWTLPAEAIAALIALAGVGMSIVAAWFTSRKTLGVEVRKAYFPKLIEQRLKSYPELYSYVSDLSKSAERRVPSLAELEALRDKVDMWDSQHAVFLGSDTVNTCHNFRVELARALLQAVGDGSVHGSRRADWLSPLLEQGSALKRGLRSDLGIYGFAGDSETRTPKGW